MSFWIIFTFQILVRIGTHEVNSKFTHVFHILQTPISLKHRCISQRKQSNLKLIPQNAEQLTEQAIELMLDTYFLALYILKSPSGKHWPIWGMGNEEGMASHNNGCLLNESRHLLQIILCIQPAKPDNLPRKWFSMSSLCLLGWRAFLCWWGSVAQEGNNDFMAV